ncbi:efflux transporter outer membrane subunit [Pararobbsia alpina]|nr:efflux transporter outer membrane subunit [Pararobbsia alpina]
MAFKRSSSLFAILLLAGCAVGPDFKQPSAPSAAGYTPQPLAPKTASAPGALGEAQNLVPGMDIPGQWWTLFQSQPLDDLINRALKANPTIAAAQAALHVTQENMLAQEGSLFPSIGLNTSGSKNETSTASLAPVAANNQRIYSLYTGQVAVSYSVDAFGLNRRTIESLAAQAENQRFELEAAYLTLSTNVVLAAVQEAGLRGQIAAQQETIKADTELRDILQREYALGELAQSDVLQQDAVLAQAQELLPPMQKQLALQRNALNALAGGLPNEDLAENFDLSSLRLPRDLPVSIASKLVEQRPDILAAAASLHAASAQVGVAIANRLPQLSLTAALGTSPNAIANAFTPYNQFFAVVGTIAQPIFQGGTLVHRQRAAQAAFAQAGAQYRVTVINAYQNVADVLQALQSDANTLQAAVNAEQAAARSLDIARKQLQFGSISYLSVLTAEQSYQVARLALVQAQAGRLSDTAALFQAMGGGWWNRTALEET